MYSIDEFVRISYFPILIRTSCRYLFGGLDFYMMYTKGVGLFRSDILCKVLFAVLWCLGIFAGSYLVLHSDASFISLMRRPSIQSVSIVGRYFLLILPFIISVIAMHLHLRFVFFLMAFSKAFLFSYSCCFLIAIFGSAGWLFQFLILFFDLITIPFLILFWTRNVTTDAHRMHRDLTLYLIFLLIILCVDYFAILPFATKLLYYV